MAKEDPVAQAIFLIAIAIVFLPLILYLVSSILNPVFILLTIFSSIATVGFGFMLFFQEEEEFTIPLGISFVVLVFSIGGWIITASIIESVPQTPEGKEQIEMYNTITGVPVEISNSINEALELSISETCKTTTEDVCNLMKTTVKTQEDLIEFQNLISKGKRYSEIVNKMS